jgi:hypothetical protein
MTAEVNTPRTSAIAYAVESLPDHHEIRVAVGATASEILDTIKARHPAVEIDELVMEDEDEPLGDDARVVERVEDEFKLIHAARRGRIAVTVVYDNDQRQREFRPSATVRRILRWAVGEKGFDLVDPPFKFVLKMGERMLEPELHLGQITRGARAIVLQLVHTRKVQG